MAGLEEAVWIVILYHFVPAHLLEIIKREGLTLGVLPVKEGKKWSDSGKEYLLKNVQWLTKNPDFSAQFWAVKVIFNYDRTAYRITISIPKSHRSKLLRWSIVSTPDNYLNRCPGWQDWYIFKGRIPPGWFRKIDKKDVPAV